MQQYRSISDKRTTQRYVFWLLLAGFAVIAAFVALQPDNRLDQSVASYIQGFEADKITSIMMFFTTVGSTKFTILITLGVLAILYAKFRKANELLFICAVLGGSALLNTVLKLIFHRARPEVHRLIEETGFSFPSGHTMAALALYGAVAFLLWRHASTVALRALIIGITALFVFMIAVSRIYLGVHFPSDIAGGILASGMWLSLVIWVYQWWQENGKTR
ncbi:phosphatase PAP2 family protein [Paenibacillus sp. GXUN7292]|uniref:phosphatase PAP2 family protein n=1 Tax=Paenibacillus sp. GXUN7292 TaxID=3422499 RepID=UPI003D7E6277